MTVTQPLSRNSRLLGNFSLGTAVPNSTKNPRNCLVADTSDRWKIGRKDRHGLHTTRPAHPPPPQRRPKKLSLSGVGVCCVKPGTVTVPMSRVSV
jgi:hypothetical protein